MLLPTAASTITASCAPRTFSTTKWLFRWADRERNLHIHKTRSFFGVLRLGLVRRDGDRMLPDHGPAADYQMPWP